MTTVSTGHLLTETKNSLVNIQHRISTVITGQILIEQKTYSVK